MSTSQPQISILGCGWLGLPLAEQLIDKGYRVKGSTTSKSKLQTLKEKGIDPYLVTLKEGGIEGDAEEFLSGSELLIIDIPPGLRRDPSRDYPGLLKNFLKIAADSTGIQHILYISSTSVFPNQDRVFTEDDTFEPDTPTGKQLRTAEQMILNDRDRKNTVLRFAGLIGSDRHPVRMLSQRSGLKGGSDRINLIHRKDCIRLITKIISRACWGRTLHGVAPYHPSKKEYYTAMAHKMQLAPPQYEGSGLKSLTGKEISGDLTAVLLDFKYSQKTPGL